MKAILWDFDGTIADNRRFGKEFKLDGVVPLNTKLIMEAFLNQPKAFQEDSIKHIILTARPEKYRKEMINWLMENIKGLRIERLFMRPKNDQRPSEEFKKEIIERDILPKYTLLMAFDDEEPVAEMLKSYTLTFKIKNV